MTQPQGLPSHEERGSARVSTLDPRINSAPAGFNPATELPKGFLEFYLPLHREFTPRQRELVTKREQVLAEAHRGRLPDHLPASEATKGDWKIDLPDWCADQRNQMTGPADDADLVVKMLNSGAPGVMLDVEDSIVNTWPHLVTGIANKLEAVRGALTYFDRKRDRTVSIQESKTVIFNRARGLHLNQGGVIQGRSHLGIAVRCRDDRLPDRSRPVEAPSLLLHPQV